MLDATTLSSPQVVDLAKDFVCVKVDTGKEGDLVKRLQIGWMPDLRILAPDGNVVWKNVGQVGVEALVSKMQSALGSAVKK
jgi:hypothetical protein